MVQGRARPWHLALLLWAVISALTLGGRLENIDRMALTGPDDYTRLLRVESMLDGTGWFETRLDRVGPPTGISLHWSMIPDLPLVGLAAIAEPFSDRETGLKFAVTAWPLIGLLAVFLIAAWAGGWLFGPAGAWMAPVSVAYANAVIGQFVPGRIDHHGLQILLSIGLLIACVGMLRRKSMGWAIAAGAVVAASLSIGVETLPYVAALYGALGIAWLAGDDNIAPAGVYSSAAAVLFGIAFLLFNNPEADYVRRACDALSGVYLSALAATSVGWLVLALIGPRARADWMRWLAAGVISVAIVAVLLTAYPECRGGPYSALPLDVQAFWLTDVDEAQTGFRLALDEPTRFLLLYFLIIVAVISAIVLARRRAWRDEPGHIAIWVFLAAAVGIAFWQIRGASFAATFAIFAALPAFIWLVDWSGQAMKAWRRWTVLVLILLIFSPVGMSALFGAMGIAPSAERTAMACALPESLEPIAAQPPGLVAASIDIGPMLIQLTPHAVVAAPYHRGVEALRNLGSVLAAASSEEAKAATDRLGVDYILLCDSAEAYGTSRGAVVGAFVTRLLAGEVPHWLDPVIGGGPEALSLYRVTR